MSGKIPFERQHEALRALRAHGEIDEEALDALDRTLAYLAPRIESVREFLQAAGPLLDEFPGARVTGVRHIVREKSTP